MKHPYFIFVPVAGLLAAAWLAAQQETPVFRVSREQVVIEFIAFDKEGNFVNDLEIDELELKVDRKKRKIATLIRPDELWRARRTDAGGGKKGDGDEARAARAAESYAAPEQARTVILIDSRSMDAGNFGFALAGIRDFIKTSLRTDHEVMIAQINPSLQVMTPFTSDTDRLVEALTKLRPARVGNSLDPSRVVGRVLPSTYMNEFAQQVRYLRAGMRTLLHTLSALPGRKHVVLFSEGYPLNPLQEMEVARRRASAFSSSETRQAASRQNAAATDPGMLDMVRDTVALANNVGVTFYTIDARGLRGLSGFSAVPLEGNQAAARALRASLQAPAAGGSPGQPLIESKIAPATFERTTLGSISSAQSMLIALAAGTNGSAFYNTNDLQSVLRASAAEQRNRYLLGFSPKKHKEGRFRKVTVNCKREGVKVRASAGYLDLPREEVLKERLSVALENPAFFTEGLSAIAQVQPTGSGVKALFGLPGSEVSLRPATRGEGSRMELVMVGQIYNEEGKPVKDSLAVAKEFKMDLKPQQARGLRRQNVVAQQEFKLDPGNYTLIIAVEDRIGGRLSTAVRNFSVPGG